MLVETATDNVVRTVANVRMHFNEHGGNLGTTGSVGFLFQRMGVFRLAPEGLDLEALELDLIDHGLEEMGEGTGEKGEKQLIIRCAFNDFGQLQARHRGARASRRSPPSPSTSPQTPSSCPRTRRTRCSSWWTRSSRTRTCSASSTTWPEGCLPWRVPSPWY